MTERELRAHRRVIVMLHAATMPKWLAEHEDDDPLGESFIARLRCAAYDLLDREASVREYGVSEVESLWTDVPEMHARLIL